MSDQGEELGRQLEALRRRLEAATPEELEGRDEHLDRVLLVVARAKMRAALRRGATLEDAIRGIGEDP